MRRDQPDKVILVCKWHGRSDRYFGKYKCFETGKWLKIPGGTFPPPFDTKEKAQMFAREWYEQAEAERAAHRSATQERAVPTWDAVCDAYVASVTNRMRGKPSTRDEAIRATNTSIRRGVLASHGPSDNDEDRCIEWLRFIAHENIAKTKSAAPRFRKPMTIRNITKHLRYLFKLALRQMLIPGLTANPAMGDEFREELKAIVAKHEQRDWLLPLDSFAKLVVCPKVPVHRRIVYLTLGLTGLRPGELAGLQLRHVLTEGSVTYFNVEQQWTSPRGKTVRPEITSPKTKWGRRYIPLHRALRSALAAWISSGWHEWTGRAPVPEDFLFAGADGNPHRTLNGKAFRRDLKVAECPTSFEGKPLTQYALRHLFSTLLTEGHASDAAHDRLLGHRPRDTKTMNYSAKLLPFLAAEIERASFDLPADGSSPRPVERPSPGGHA